jgi:hypothetical protein
MLGIALRPDPKGWEYNTQPPFYEVDIPEPEDIRERNVRTNSLES